MVLLPGLWRNRISGDRSFHIMETAAKEDLDDLVYEQKGNGSGYADPPLVPLSEVRPRRRCRKPSSVARMVINNAML